MSNIIINIEYLKSWNGIFKILQLVLGMVCVGIIGNEFNNGILISYTPQCFFLVTTSTFFIGTFILFASYLMSPSATSMIPKTIYEFFYHTVASILLLAASIAIMVQINRDSVIYNYAALLAASICGLLNTILYICSAVMGYSTYGDD